MTFKRLGIFILIRLNQRSGIGGYGFEVPVNILTNGFV